MPPLTLMFAPSTLIDWIRREPALANAAFNVILVALSHYLALPPDLKGALEAMSMAAIVGGGIATRQTSSSNANLRTAGVDPVAVKAAVNAPASLAPADVAPVPPPDESLPPAV